VIQSKTLLENDYSSINKDINEILLSPVETALYFCNSFKRLNFDDSNIFLANNSKKIKRIERRINKSSQIKDKYLNKFSSKTCKLKKIKEKSNATFIKLEGMKKLKLKEIDSAWKIVNF
jgi:hypothetical protein